MHDTDGEVRTNSYAKFSYGPRHMYMQVLDDLQKPIYNSSLWTQNVV